MWEEQEGTEECKMDQRLYAAEAPAPSTALVPYYDEGEAPMSSAVVVASTAIVVAPTAAERREAIKAAARASIKEHQARFSTLEDTVLDKDVENALVVAAAMELVRADDEALLEKAAIRSKDAKRRYHQGAGEDDLMGCDQHALRVTDPTPKVALYDEKNRLRFDPRFEQYAAHDRPPLTEAVWWPWGCSSEQSSDEAMRLVEIVRKRRCADPCAVALEAGTALAAAAACVASRKGKPPSTYAEQRRLGLSKGGNSQHHFEVEAREMFSAATRASDPQRVLRRALFLPQVRESLRRRKLLTPEKRAEEIATARRLHARELAAERRRQRSRRSAARLALTRDAARAQGAAGRLGWRSAKTDLSVFCDHARGYLALFILDDDDATDYDEEHDYDRNCEYAASLDEERLKALMATRKQGIKGVLVDRDHAKRHVSAPSLESLPAPPTSLELRLRRDAALKTLNALLLERGAGHLDVDSNDDWVPDASANAGHLGKLQMLHREILEECVERNGDDPFLLSCLGKLAAKTSDHSMAKAVFLKAATQRHKQQETSEIVVYSKRREQAPLSGSIVLPGAGPRSKDHRLDREFRSRAPRIAPRTRTFLVADLDPSELPNAKTREVPWRDSDVAKLDWTEEFMERTVPKAGETSMLPFYPHETTMNLLHDPRPGAYSAAKAALPRGDPGRPSRDILPMPMRQPQSLLRPTCFLERSKRERNEAIESMHSQSLNALRPVDDALTVNDRLDLLQLMDPTTMTVPQDLQHDMDENPFFAAKMEPAANMDWTGPLRLEETTTTAATPKPQSSSRRKLSVRALAKNTQTLRKVLPSWDSTTTW